MTTNEFDFPLAEVPTDRAVYPPGQVTVLGEQLLLEHVDPLMMFTSQDRKRIFHFSGPLAPWPGQQDGIQLVEITPPTPDFKQLKSKGGRQHGKTYGATVFDEAEISLVLVAHATTPEGLGEVVSDWMAMWHPRKLVRFEWMTFDKGLWWMDARRGKVWNDRITESPRRHKRQVITHTIENQQAFWRSVDSMSSFKFVYDDFEDTFGTDYPLDMGPLWPVHYDGPAGGYAYVKGGLLRWRDDPNDLLGTDWRHVIYGPRKGFDTETDKQVVTKVIDNVPEWSLPESGKFYIGARMNRDEDDEWDGDGVFAEIGRSEVEIVRYNNFVRTPMFRKGFWPPPFWGEEYTLIAGGEGDALRTFTVLRGDSEILSRTENGTGSAISPDHRGVGGGLYAGAAIITQASPPDIRSIRGGDNALTSQTGFLYLTNIGSEDGWPNFVVRGPLTEIGIGDGPGSQDMIKFGPLHANQEVLISTHPLYRNIVDLTSTGTLTAKQRKQVEDMAKLVAYGQVPTLLSWYESVYGVLPPQGNLYEKLIGRFSRAIPGVDQPTDAVTSKIAVSITGGDAKTRVLGAVTPQRIWPE